MQECQISRQYLYQASSFVCGVCLLALPAVQGYSGYVLFAWLYGIFYGGFQYSLKMCTYEKVRARNFAKTWGFVQGSQAIPVLLGAPVTGQWNGAERPPSKRRATPIHTYKYNALSLCD